MFRANLPKCSECWCHNKDLVHTLQQKMLVDSSMIHNLPPPLSEACSHKKSIPSGCCGLHGQL